LVAQETGRDADAVAALDRRAEEVFKDVAALGAAAAGPLGFAARDAKRPAKTRFFAVTFLSRLGVPASFAPLSGVLLDEEQDPDARLAAAQGLSGLDVPAADVRRTFCAAVAQAGLPRPVLDTSLIALTRLGCGDPAPLARAARLFGPRPAGAELATTRRALDALSKSSGAAPARALLVLARYFPSRGAARAATISALAESPARVVSSLEAEALPIVSELLRSESGEPAEILVLIRISGRFGPAAEKTLRSLLSNADDEVLAAAAEALARRKAVAALPALDALIAGALTGPRFKPRPGRPDPALILARLEAAAAALRREPDALK
ncbi:MAG: hypothetical protein ACHQ49_18405, partial [Elusimicrobiota bacterium]